MAFTEVMDLDASVTVSLGGRDKKTGRANPTQVEGYFLGSKQVTSKRAKTGYSYLHILQTPEGNLGVWGKTDLDRKLRSVSAGTMIRVTQNGMKPTPNGDMYTYKVEQDQSNTIEVNFGTTANNIIPVTASESSSDEGSDDSDLFEETPSDEPSIPQPVRPAQAAQVPNAARRAETQALLNRSRTKTA